MRAFHSGSTLSKNNRNHWTGACGVKMGSDSDSDDDGDICLHSIAKDGDMLRTKNFGDKKKSRKKAKKKWGRIKGPCLWTRKGHCKKWKGGDRKVIFLIGYAYGKDECDLGPLDNPGHDLAIFRDDHNDDDVDGDDGSGDDSDDEDWKILVVEKDSGGINIKEFNKKKKAKKKFQKLENKDRPAVLVSPGGSVKDVTNCGGNRGEKEVTFMIGVAAGRGMLKRGELGPLDEGGKLSIFDDEDDNWGAGQRPTPMTIFEFERFLQGKRGENVTVVGRRLGQRLGLRATRWSAPPGLVGTPRARAHAFKFPLESPRAAPAHALEPDVHHTHLAFNFELE